MAKSRDMDIGLLRQLLAYDPNTGKITWTSDSPPSDEVTTEALCFNCNGYRIGRINGTSYRAHRVAWALFYGVWPRFQIDHINGIRSDNRIVNLRDVSQSENFKNQARYKNNNSGVTGVSWSKNNNRYVAYIYLGKSRVHLGSFKSIEEATRARHEANLMYGFHPNHGRVAGSRC
jgi:hypothetical protein